MYKFKKEFCNDPVLAHKIGRGEEKETGLNKKKIQMPLFLFSVELLRKDRNGTCAVEKT